MLGSIHPVVSNWKGDSMQILILLSTILCGFILETVIDICASIVQQFVRKESTVWKTEYG